MDFEFHVPPHIHFGWGKRELLGKVAKAFGSRAFLVHGSKTLAKNGVFEDLCRLLETAGVYIAAQASIHREPLVEDVDQTTAAFLKRGVQAGDLVIAVGGGAAVDLAKAVAAMVTNRHGESVRDFMEGVGKGLTLTNEPLTVVALPTTSGTGSEATKNAVVSSVDPPFKKSLRSTRMIPSAVIVDPELTVSVPRETTSYTGMDAVTQLIESYLSCRAQPIPQALCVHGLSLAMPALPKAVADPKCRWAREQMSYSAFLSGMALANSGLGMAHGVAAALGIHCRIPHGLACAVMLPAALRVNRPTCTRQLAELAPAILGTRGSSEEEAAAAVVEAVESLCDELHVPRKLSDLGVSSSQLPAIAAGSRGNSMNGNPRPIGDDELLALLEEML